MVKLPVLTDATGFSLDDLIKLLEETVSAMIWEEDSFAGRYSLQHGTAVWVPSLGQYGALVLFPKGSLEE